MSPSETEDGLIAHIRSFDSRPSLEAWGKVRTVGSSFQGLDDAATARVWRDYQAQIEALSQIELWGM